MNSVSSSVTGGGGIMIMIETGDIDTGLGQTLLEGPGIGLDHSHHHDHNHMTGEGVLLLLYMCSWVCLEFIQGKTHSLYYRRSLISALFIRLLSSMMK
jgi:hypothetical protein